MLCSNITILGSSFTGKGEYITTNNRYSFFPRPPCLQHPTISHIRCSFNGNQITLGLIRFGREVNSGVLCRSSLWFSEDSTFSKLPIFSNQFLLNTTLPYARNSINFSADITLFGGVGLITDPAMTSADIDILWGWNANPSKYSSPLFTFTLLPPRPSRPHTHTRTHTYIWSSPIIIITQSSRTQHASYY